MLNTDIANLLCLDYPTRIPDSNIAMATSHRSSVRSKGVEDGCFEPGGCGHFHEPDEGVGQRGHVFSTEQVTFGFLVDIFSSPDPVNHYHKCFLGDVIDRPILTIAFH